MTAFNAYEKMPTALAKLGLEPEQHAKLNKAEWVVTEKIHGANFSFSFEDGRIRYANRKQWLEWSDDFFGFQMVAESLDAALYSFFQEVGKHYSGQRFTLYGELYGGHYPHPDVAPQDGVYAIQTGVWYSPQIRFCAFDLAILDEAENKTYVPYSELITWAKKHDVPCVEPLFCGSLTAALNHKFEFETTLPAQFDLPAIADNWAEGIVVKPWSELLVDGPKGPVRPMVKIKHPKFNEKQDYHAAEAWSWQPQGRSREEDLGYLLPELHRYVTQNRFDAAVSKIGAITSERPERRQLVTKELLDDVVASFEEDHPGLWSELDQADQDWLQVRLSAEVSKLIDRIIGA